MYLVTIEETGEIKQGDVHREGVIREGFLEVIPEPERGAAKEWSELCTASSHIRLGPRLWGRCWICIC